MIVNFYCFSGVFVMTNVTHQRKVNKKGKLADCHMLLTKQLQPVQQCNQSALYITEASVGSFIMMSL